jgi:hypothetical protein
MQTPKYTMLALILAGGLSLTARAQIGTGWSSWSPSHSTQTVGCGSVSGTTFHLSCGNTSGEQRAEFRYSTFSSGTKQFQGTVKVTSLGGDRISLQQTFQDGVGPWSLIAVKKSGSLYQVEGGNTLSSYTVGTSVRINAICSTSSDKVDNYVNGSLKNTKTGGSGSYYFKFGTYRTGSGFGPITATWSSISFYQK